MRLSLRCVEGRVEDGGGGGRGIGVIRERYKTLYDLLFEVTGLTGFFNLRILRLDFCPNTKSTNLCLVLIECSRDFSWSQISESSNGFPDAHIIC